MAISKKGTRKIVVNGISYIWKVKKKSKSSDDILIVAIQKEENGNRLLVVYTGCFRADSGYAELLNLPRKVVTPIDVESYIVKALADGWDPESNGSAFEVSAEVIF